jgi:cellulose biosynthesis protein BcsQ
LKIVAVTNIKGGVGKTTTAVNLAYLCAAGGRATVLWDLDPQGAATYTLQCEPGERVSARKLVSGKRELPELIVHTTYDKLDVLPADFSYRNFDVHLSERKKPTEVPYSSEIERMTQRRAPLPAFSPRSAVGQVYAALWAEVEAHMGAE